MARSRAALLFAPCLFLLGVRQITLSSSSERNGQFYPRSMFEATHDDVLKRRLPARSHLFTDDLALVAVTVDVDQEVLIGCDARLACDPLLIFPFRSPALSSRRSTASSHPNRISCDVFSADG